MKSIVGYLIGAALFALVGMAALRAAGVDTNLARAEANLVAAQYDDPSTTFDEAEQYYAYTARLPGVGNGPLNEIRARKAALQYWQRNYAAIVPQQSDPVGTVPSDNVELQLVTANAVFRSGEAQAKDKATYLQAIDAGIAAYASVLKNSPREEDAAYNYEYLVRIRDEVDKGKKKPGGEATMRGPEGAAGKPPTIESTMGDFKIYIPLESQERQENGVAGKAGAIKRKG